MHDAASAWNAGFIRQVCNRRVLLPDKSGVPVGVSKRAIFAPGGCSTFTRVRPTGLIDTAIIAKLLPKNGERISAGERMVVT
jgi:hypothetical protein